MRKKEKKKIKESMVEDREKGKGVCLCERDSGYALIGIIMQVGE